MSEVNFSVGHWFNKDFITDVSKCTVIKDGETKPYKIYFKKNRITVFTLSFESKLMATEYYNKFSRQLRKSKLKIL